MEGIMGIIALIILGSGVFSLHAWYNMQFNGVISESLFLGKHYDGKKIKDKETFIKKASPVLLIFAVMLTICGVISSLRHYVITENELLITMDQIANAIVLIVLFWFGFYTTKLKKLYF